MLKEQKIKNLNQVEYSYEEFIKILKQYDSEGYDAYIGTDSQVIKNKIYIATCIAFVRRNSRYGSDCSGRVFYVKEKILKKTNRVEDTGPFMILRAINQVLATKGLEQMPETFESLISLFDPNNEEFFNI